MNAVEQAQQEGIKNRHAVWNFFRKNPCHTKGECAKALNLTPHTVGVHCKAIREGWRPDKSAHLSAMRDRFLIWPLPEDFTPDGGITFQQLSPQTWPSGTNLLNAAQAAEMVEYIAQVLE